MQANHVVKRRRGVAPSALVLALVLAAGACSSPTGPSGSSGRSTQDQRVKSYRGQVPPDVFRDGTWVGRAGPTSLGQLRGQVVYLQFAFPQ